MKNEPRFAKQKRVTITIDERSSTALNELIVMFGYDDVALGIDDATLVRLLLCTARTFLRDKIPVNRV